MGMSTQGMGGGNQNVNVNDGGGSAALMQQQQQQQQEQPLTVHGQAVQAQALQQMLQKEMPVGAQLDPT